MIPCTASLTGIHYRPILNMGSPTQFMSRTKTINRVPFLLCALLICSPAFAQITLAIGQADMPATASSSAQTWPGCSSGCLSVNPAYVVLPGSTRRIWTNVCLGTNAWGGTGYPAEVASCAYPPDIRVTWTVNSGACAMNPSPASIYSVLTVPANATTQVCSITATTVATPPASVTIHVFVVKPAADSNSSSASTALHTCGASGVATCVHVMPFYEVLYQGQYADLQAYVSGKINMGVTWSVSPSTGGLSILNGTTNRSLAIKGVSAGTYTITATSTADGTAAGSAKIIVTGNSIAGQTRTSKAIPVDCTPVGSGTTYEVTDSKTFAAVPWGALTAGDTVRIHYGTYAIPFQIGTSGTATQPIRICGLPDGSGNIPILTGNNAGPGNVTSAQQPYGLIVLATNNFAHVNCAIGTGCSQPPEPDPHSIVIEGLKIQSAYSAYNRAGGAGAWAVGAGSIRIGARDVVVRGNEITDSSNGVFCISQATELETSMVRRVTIEGNYIYGNGEVGGFSQHNNYLQGDELLYQWNWVGTVRSGSGGGSVKIRMPYSVVRYNYIQGSARLLDMVELQDWHDYGIPSSYYADNMPTTTPTDPLSIADVAVVAEHLQKDYIYGNVFDNNALNGNSAAFPIHYFPDVFANREKGGTGYFYHNTDREIHDASGAYQGFTELIDSSRVGPLPGVWPQTRLTNNAIDLECATSNCANGKPQFSFAVSYQDIIGLDKNWITTGWDSTTLGAGPSPAWSHCCGSPSNNGASCFQTVCTDSSSSNYISAESNLVAGAVVPFNATTFVPIAGSPLASSAGPLPAEVSDMPPEFTYRPDTQAVTPRTDIVSNAPLTIGAADSAITAARPLPPTSLQVTPR